MRSDLTQALRLLFRSRGISIVAVATLALGIGTNAAIFSVVHAVLLKPLPYPEPSRLMMLRETVAGKEDSMPVSPPSFADWRVNRSFQSIGAYATGSFILTGGGEPVRVPGADVSGRFFETLAVRPALGRPLVDADDVDGGPLVAVIGFDLWMSRLGGDPGVIGRRLTLSDKSYQIVGVMPRGFDFPDAAEIWVPLALPPGEFDASQRMSFYLDAIARLAPGISREQASSEMTAIAARAATAYPKSNAGRGVAVVPLRESIVGDVRRPLMILLGVVAIVMLIACANVANLLLARAAARRDEMAVRMALGAGRWRIFRQMLVESLVLAGAGAAAGLLLASWTRDAIVALAPAGVPRIDQVRIDPAVIAFTLALAFVTAIVFGVAPALAASRPGGGAPRGLRSAAGTGGGRAVRGALVIVELTLSVALLVGAGLLARTFWKLVTVDPGFRPDGVMTMEVVLPRPKYAEPERRVAMFDRVLEVLRENPMIEAVGATTNLPLAGGNMSFGFYTQNMTPDRDTPHIANFRGVTPGYFRAMGVPVLRGRAIAASDRPGSPPVVVINDAMAREYWPNADPIGERIAITRGRETVWREIVGVVGSVRQAAVGTPPAPEMYMPYVHDPFPFLRFVVRTSLGTDAAAGAMRAAVWMADPAQPVTRVRPMRDVIAASLADARFNAVLIGAFAVLALAIAGVGLYGVIAYTIALRLPEIGVRMALGAERRHVLGLVLRQSLALTLVGVALGMGLALGLTRAIATQLFATAPTDAVTFGGVALALTLVALAASYVPARRALRVDPAAALRAE
ncbi:MAG TPA: ABC transporter permease [Vicinamibacterales bacterium]|nr:ABC transporter permease [Vicinamibacterales bacterium]